MDVVSLTTFLKQNHILTAVVFPLEAARYVPASDVIPQVNFEGRDSNENTNTNRTADFFLKYINEMDQRTAGKQTP
jgi:hypothetical protein